MKPEKKNKTHYMENDKETTEPVLIHAAEMAFGASADESRATVQIRRHGRLAFLKRNLRKNGFR